MKSSELEMQVQAHLQSENCCAVQKKKNEKKVCWCKEGSEGVPENLHIYTLYFN